jgi:hypothetical protein
VADARWPDTVGRGHGGSTVDSVEIGNLNFEYVFILAN